MWKRLKPKLALFLAGLGVLHILFLLGLLCFRFIWDETVWFLILFRYAPPILFVLLWLAVSILDFVANGKKALPASLVSGVLVLLFFLNISLPWQRVSGEADLVAVSYNIQAGLGGPEKVANFLREQKADVLCLQEARPPVVNPDVDPAPILAKELNDYYHARGGVKGELLTLTRFPIEEQSERVIGKWARVLDVTVTHNDSPLRILNVHCVMGSPGGLSPSGLEHSARARHEQATKLMEIAREKDVPTILLGDFNTTPNSRAHQILSGELNDNFGRAGFGLGWTFPARLPLLRIDYVWSRGFDCTDVRLVSNRLSDHYAVKAGLQRSVD